MVNTVSQVKPSPVFQLCILFATMEVLSRLRGECGGPEVARQMSSVQTDRLFLVRGSGESIDALKLCVTSEDVKYLQISFSEFQSPCL